MKPAAAAARQWWASSTAAPTSNPSSSPSSSPPSNSTSPSALSSLTSKSSNLSPKSNTKPPPPPKLSPFSLKRTFNAVGSAAYVFVQMGSYRGGPATFSVVGLASKPLHVFSKPEFLCTWVPHNNLTASISGTCSKFLPDWGYGRVYTVVVVNCSFPVDVGADGIGGELVITATSGGGGDGDEERFIALEEAPGSLNLSLYNSLPRYDYLYCGSSLYGSLSPHRVREWIAYHVRLFGERSHFVIHDAGGVHDEVLEVLSSWIEKGFVTLHNVREQERFDGYNHNQFLVVNDCLHRYRFMAKWMFFFDVDEFIYVEKRVGGIGRFMDSMMEFTQFTIQQMPMSSKLCLSSDSGRIARMWGIEKLVCKDVKRGIKRDRKYAIQPRNAFSAGVHLSQNFMGKTTHKTEGKIKYFHYHSTIASRREPCREFVNTTELTYEGIPYYRDETLRGLANHVKKFELRTIGKRLVRTKQ